jgi:hypothetical protein
VLIARPGAILLTTQIPSTDVSEAQGREFRMLSGWDNEDPDMQGIFLARGPGNLTHKILISQFSIQTRLHFISN